MVTDNPKEIDNLPQYRVGLVCNDPRVLPELSNRLKEPWSTIVEKEKIFYWSSTHFDALATVPEVDEYATRLLPVLNGLVKLHIENAGELVKAGRIKFINDKGQEVTQVTLAVTLRGSAALIIHEDEKQKLEARKRWISIAEKSLEKREDLPINRALDYYGREHKHNWQTLYKVYETIQKEYRHSQGVSLPEEWTKDETGKSREKDFTESANNAYLSGYTARHSLEASYPIRIVPGSTHVKVILSRSKEIDIHPMTLEEAKTFIARLLTYWLTQKLGIA